MQLTYPNRSVYLLRSCYWTRDGARSLNPVYPAAKRSLQLDAASAVVYEVGTTSGSRVNPRGRDGPNLRYNLAASRCGTLASRR